MGRNGEDRGEMTSGGDDLDASLGNRCRLSCEATHPPFCTFDPINFFLWNQQLTLYLNVERAPARARRTARPANGNVAARPRGLYSRGVGPMKTLALLVLCLGALGVLWPIVLYFDEEVLSRQDPPGMQHLTLSDWLREERRGPQLEADGAIMFHVNDEDRKITADLIEGRLSLCAAADALRAVRDSKPARLRAQDDYPPERASEEYFVRRAFRGAEIELRDDPRREAILARLQAELDDFLCAQAALP
jgi:hypothetical protein